MRTGVTRHKIVELTDDRARGSVAATVLTARRGRLDRPIRHGHAGQGNVLLPMLNQGELAVLYCFVFLYFVFSGAGAWSVDSVRAGRPAARLA